MIKKSVSILSLIALMYIPAHAEAPVKEFESSKVCRECHEDIYTNWKKSLHALSYNNPIFLTAYRKAYTETAGEAKKLCLDCHAPTVRVTGDYDVKQQITAEGVTCDFCHTVTGIDLESKGDKFKLELGEVKRSVLKDAKSAYHETAYSADFASSKLCAGCHDFKNRKGVHVGVTYTEWKDSSFAREGKECQNCHMPEMPGKTAKDGGRNRIHDHSLTHNLSTMQNVVSLETVSIEKTSKKMTVKVKVTNSLVGHSIPTGTPARKLVLEVRSLDSSGTSLETMKRVYGKTVLSGTGIPLESDGDAFLYGESIAGDNRLKSGEARVETFYFTAASGKVRSVEALAYFLYEPVVSEEKEMRIPLAVNEWEIGGRN